MNTSSRGEARLKLVMKFGGSSLSTGSRVKSVARIVESLHEGNRVAVVVSALGETTDRLVEIGEYARKGDLRRARAIASRLENSHLRIAKSVRGRIGGPGESAVEGLLQDLKRTVEGISQLRELTPRSRDYLLSIGERLSAPIVTEAFVRAGMKARSFTGGEAGISTDENFGEARPLQEVTFHQVRQRLDPLLTKGVIPVVTGFVGATLEGSITTLGRGGSDYTSTLLGAALGADEVWIWTNVDGLMTGPPNSEECTYSSQSQLRRSS